MHLHVYRTLTRKKIPSNLDISASRVQNSLFVWFCSGLIHGWITPVSELFLDQHRSVRDITYTVSHKKVLYSLMFDNNFGKCGPIFKILLPIDLQENSLSVHHKDFHHTCNMLLHYLVKVENPKLLLISTASSTNC